MGSQDQIRKWRRELHAFDPETEEEKKELALYLEQLAHSSPVIIDSPSENTEEEDMRLWSLVDL